MCLVHILGILGSFVVTGWGPDMRKGRKEKERALQSTLSLPESFVPEAPKYQVPHNFENVATPSTSINSYGGRVMR